MSHAATARSKYFEAEACYKKLRLDSQRQKYRHNWLTCIDKFKAVYMHEPSGDWAAAGLYQTGSLYHELYRHSKRLSDKQEAVDVFRRLIKRYPQSGYRASAQKV